MLSRASAAIACILLLPAANAGLVDDVEDLVGDLADQVPDCKAASPPWAVGCADGSTFIGCGTDAGSLYRCRILFEGDGGDVDGGSAAAMGRVLDEGLDGLVASGLRIAGSGGNVATTVSSEGKAWQSWGRNETLGLPGTLFMAKQPYQDAAEGFAYGVRTQGRAYLQENLDDIESTVMGSVTDGQEYGFSISMDSGPVTASVTSHRPPDDPCSPDSGLRVFGSDCQGPLLVDGMVSASVDCNAYTTITSSQPCGGFVASDWNWRMQGAALYAGPARTARLSFESDGRATIHDILGVLYCNAPQYENGYWLQTMEMDFSDNTIHGFGRHDGDILSVFGEDAGTCTISAREYGYAVTYDVLFNGIPVRATGSFYLEDGVEDFADCRAEVDSRTSQSGSCDGAAIHGGIL